MPHYVIARGRFSGNGRRAAWVAADVVRIEDGELAEHWDVLQEKATQAQSVSGCRCSATAFPSDIWRLMIVEGVQQDLRAWPVKSPWPIELPPKLPPDDVVQAGIGCYRTLKDAQELSTKQGKPIPDGILRHTKNRITNAFLYRLNYRGLSLKVLRVLYRSGDDCNRLPPDCPPNPTDNPVRTTTFLPGGTADPPLPKLVQLEPKVEGKLQDVQYPFQRCQ